MNRPWRALIADDEPLGRRRLVLALEHVSGVELVGEAGDGESLLSLARAHDPDIVLLDVVMPGLTGLEVAEALGGESRRALVFVTAHEAFARRAFDVEAVDYLLKPFSLERFDQALERAIRHCALARVPNEDWMSEVWVSDRRGRRRIPVEQIDWIAAEGDYSRVHTGARSLLCNDSLGRLARRLDPFRFVRVHRSAMVRLEAVRAVLRSPGGQIQLATGAVAPTPVGRRFRPILRRALNGQILPIT
jgi:DNA-binding LytR/AlgR family response regulator